MKKTIFSEANTIYRKHWWKSLILDTLFLAVTFLFFIYARAKIKAYFALISTHAAQVSAVEAAIAQNSASGMGQMQELLSILSPIAKQLSFFTFFIVPLVIFALWCLFQAPNYTLIAKNKLLSFTHYIRFIVFTAPFYIAGLFLLNEIFDIVYQAMFSALTDWRFYVWTFLLLLSCYLLQACYAFTLNQKYKDIVKSALCVLKKPHKMAPAFALYAFLWFLVMVSMINFYLNWVGSGVSSTIIAALPLLGILALMSWARVVFTLKAMKCE
ncbi:MAG: hypothetical protein KJ955_04845 [Nanoarchaeota archaeon]|nr:hypothetical protein [Nanoarchaeota archaeon]